MRVSRQSPTVKKSSEPDWHKILIAASSRFHTESCPHLARVADPREIPLYRTFFDFIWPCRSCHTSEEFANWLQTAKSFHINCSPHRPFGIGKSSKGLKRPIGRPRAFSPRAFKRILIHLRDGRSYREVAEAIQESEGVSCTRQTVWRAAHLKKPYDSPEYRAIAEAVRQ